jgi:2,4-dienoyl-CoA reductase (NADPH2)
MRSRWASALRSSVHEGHSPTLDLPLWLREWGIDPELVARGGVEGVQQQPAAPAREVFLLQRSPGKPGERLNKTTGWVHRTTLKMKRVQMVSGVTYERIDERGLHVIIGNERRTLAVDNVVVCAGQVSNRALAEPLAATGRPVHLIGGAELAGELDAKRAIDRGTRLALAI